MQQGMLSSLLLSLSLLTLPVAVSAKEMQESVVEQWLQDTQIQTKVSELLEYVVRDEVDSLKFSLDRLAFPQQEVVRFRLLEKLEQQNIILTPRMALFVESQVRLTPTYQMLERGDGYEFSVPAFNYPAIASRLIKRWKQDQSTLDFVLQAERKELNLQQWLTGTSQQIQTRESLLIRELDSLSPSALKALTTQLTQANVTSWLPSTVVVVRMAQVSQDKAMYDLLWRMRADYNSQQELKRLADTGDAFSLQQLMNATINPSLKPHAIRLLTKSNPLSPEVKQFLIAKMALSEEATLVARQLAQQGHQTWLEELISSNRQVKARQIEQVLK
ncbi:hypothetical protein [Vibrio parahaemolyticus]|uniref:hypothetical protein n=1 Tax=Vibrio parahaemolyticus TaxID=670 RepID=UPI00038E1C7E|nr:hypothetical protein [Vibrio parahaemolyticus]ANQ54760.1 hypothetical protein AB831_00325 [Vibrio parahaemolyticus]ASO14579.1 hypothetical protein BGM07_009090 [Vibrio parahaemolyticus]AWA87814.1 hypothetical protein BSG32_01535 [Vibrio parahaemolyticus]EGQ7717383.1 hypothetical protein [Vibrio parahaemolyticus]EGQ7722146.1 hypothetical protein [Vibrio parahaemolyticus]